VRAHLKRGWVHERLDHPNEAEADYRAILTTHPDHDGAALHLAQVLVQLGRPADALPLLQRLSTGRADGAAVRLGLARCHGDLGHTDEAIRLLDELLAEHPEEGAAFLERGKLALHAGQAERAEAWLRQAAALAPHDYPTQYQLCLCLRQCGRAAEAREQEKVVAALEADLKQMNELTYALQARPDDANLRCRIGQIFLRRGEEREGLIWLTGVLRQAPTHAATHQALAAYYEARGNPERAAEHRRAAEMPQARMVESVEGTPPSR
jgi:tetratricopeptide (TPR) repeat protein